MANPKVVFESWRHGGSEGQRRFSNVAENILYPAIETQICFHVPHQEKVGMIKDGRFHIHIWSTLKENRRAEAERAPDCLYGIEVDCRDGSYAPVGNEKSEAIFYCPKTRYAVAELFENNLFIHYDMCHIGSSREASIFEKLLCDVVNALCVEPEKLALRLQKELDTVRAGTAKSKEEFVKICCERYNRLLKEAEGRFKFGKEQVENLHGKMKESHKLKDEAIKTLESYVGDGSIKVSTFAAEYDKLIQIPGVSGVDVSGDSINVYTSNITITDKGVTYLIGKFRIEIPIFVDRSTLKFINLTNKGKGPGANPPKDFGGNAEFNRHHPHVKESGVACLGNIGNALMNYIREYQYSVVAILAIQFLKSVNTDDSAGRGIRWWPRA